MKGTVIKSTGSWYTVMDSNHNSVACKIKGKFRMAGIKSTNPIAVGDIVDYETEKDGNGTITAIAPRKNYIIRKSINLSKQTHILAANIDQALLIVTLALPRTSQGFVDRFLITAEAYHIPVVIVFNKMDIVEQDEKAIKELNAFGAMYTNIGYKCLKVSAKSSKDIKQIRSITANKTTLIAGHSGVGKSAIANALDGNLNLRIGEISDVHLKGKHTTTFAEMHELNYGGFIIDTPGIKELGLIEMEKVEISGYFPEMRELRQACKFNNCLHINEPNCAVIKAVEQGDILEARYESYWKIIHGEELENNSK